MTGTLRRRSIYRLSLRVYTQDFYYHLDKHYRVLTFVGFTSFTYLFNINVHIKVNRYQRIVDDILNYRILRLDKRF